MEKYIISIKQLTISLLVISVTVLGIAVQDYKSSAQASNFLMFHFLYSVVSTFTESLGHLDRLAQADLTSINVEASIKYESNRTQLFGTDGEEGQRKDNDRLKFDSQPLLDAYLLKDIPSIIDPYLPCSAAVYQGNKKENVFLFDLHDPVFTNDVQLSNVYLINLSYHCKTIGLYPYSVLILDLREYGGPWMIGVPRELPIPNSLLTWRPLSASNVKWQASEISLQASDYRSGGLLNKNHYLTLEDKYRLVPLPLFINEIFAEARNATGRIRAPNDLQGAFEDLSTFNSKQGSIEGLSLSADLIINIAPLITFVFVALIYNRTVIISKLIDDYRDIPDEPWLVKDAFSLIDILGRQIAMATPLITTAAIYFAFSLYNDEPFGFSKWVTSFSFWFQKPQVLVVPKLLNIYDAYRIYPNILIIFFLLSASLSIKSWVMQHRKIPTPYRPKRKLL